jgi:citrate lyase subunit beta/citryl-CoA lyase
MIEKARGLKADVIALDLEDAVAPDLKDLARRQACEAVGAFAGREVVIRINALDSVWGKYDLAAVRAARPDAVLLPKVSGAGDVIAAGGDMPVWAMIETPMAVLHVAAIAASGTACLCLGTNDLLNDMQGTALPDRRNLWSALSQTVIAARAHGLGVIDGTFNDIHDAAGFEAACAQGKAFGFDGKTLIHPGQVEACNRLFAPSPDEIAAARRLLAAFDAPENKNRGVLALDGRMVERLHANNAARLVALAKAIAERA